MTSTQNTNTIQSNINASAFKVLDMFESQYTEQLQDRKANAIVRFCKERKDGFYYEELQSLIKMVNYSIADLKAGVLEMANAIVKIQEVAGLPFKMNKTSDQLKYVPLLPEFLNSFK